MLDKVWHLYIGQSWLGTLTPTGADDNWYYADFTQGDAWGNFAPWFNKAAEAQMSGGDWESVYQQLYHMGLSLVADDGETYERPQVFVDGGSAWFIV